MCGCLCVCVHVQEIQIVLHSRIWHSISLTQVAVFSIFRDFWSWTYRECFTRGEPQTWRAPFFSVQRAQRFLLPLPQGSHPSPPLLLLLPSVIYLKGRVGERERQGERDFLSTGLLLQTSVSRSDKSQELRTPSESPSWLAWNQVLGSCSAAFPNTLQGA